MSTLQSSIRHAATSAIQLCLVLALGLAAFPGGRCFAQSATGSITGQVTDRSGAVIPGAAVTLTNKGTGQSITATSDREGYYSFQLLQPAVYSLKATSNGFSTFTQNNIMLDVGLNLKVNAPLSVGGASESIVVTDAPPDIETQNTSLGQVIDNQQITDLPTNGRNSYSFAALVPGVYAPPGFTHTAFDEYSDQFVSINGARPNQNIFLLDGGLNSEPAFNGPGYFPSVDLVAEYRVQTNNFSAEFSNAAGGVINVITKSGTQKFHGTAYEFYRSDALNANDFFSDRYSIAKGKFTFNQFGATLGGPIARKTFFFGNYEGFRQNSAGFFETTVPSLAQRSGDFSKTYDQSGNLIKIYDPNTTTPDPNNPGHFLRTQYNGNQITNINPVAQALLAYYPLPNSPGLGANGVDNFQSKNPTIQQKDEGSLRIDHTFSDRLRLFGRVSQARATQPYAQLFGTTPNLISSSTNPAQDQFIQTQATGELTYVITPSLLLEANTSFIRYTLNRSLANFDLTSLGLPSYFATLAAQHPSCFPTIGVQGMTNLGDGCSFLRDAYQVYYDYFNLKKQLGTHNLSFGADVGFGTLGSARALPAGAGFTFTQNYTQGPDAVNGTPGAVTGYGFASLLAGAPATGTVNFGPNQIVHYQLIGGYAQDSWKVTNRLTVNLGVRYDINLPYQERQNRINDFDPNITPPMQVAGLQLKGGLEYPGTGGLPRTQFNTNYDNFAPRVGVAYSATSTTVFHGGFGIFFGPITGAGFNYNVIPSYGFSASTQEITSQDLAHVATTLSNPFPQGFVQPTGSSQGALTGWGQSIVGSSRDRRTPYAEQWNVDLEQVLAKNLVFDVAYAGNHSVHLPGNYTANELPDKYLSLNTSLFDQVPNPFYGIIKQGSLSLPTVNRRQLLLPYPQYTGVVIANDPYGGATYNALQAKLEKRYSNGVSLLGAFTWSKLIDNINSTQTYFPGANFYEPDPQDWYNLRSARSVSDFDLPFLTSVSASYDLPFGKGRHFLNHGGWTDRLIGGWQLNTIETLQSGNPFTVVLAIDNIHNLGTYAYASTNGQPYRKSGPAKNRLNGYFNVNAFYDQGPYAYGNVPRVIGDLRTPGVFNTDLSGIKNIAIYKGVSGQFRAEAFNVWNHPQFGFPDVGYEDGNTGNITSQANNPRQIQLAFKVIF